MKILNYKGNKQIGNVNPKKMKKSGVLTIEAAYIVPLIMVITLSLVEGAGELHALVEEKSNTVWDETYAISRVRALKLIKDLAAD